MTDPIAKICSMLALESKKAQRRAKLMSPCQNTGMEAIRDAIANVNLKNNYGEWHNLALYL